MTQAFNLSQFANKVNTSGQADLTTAVTGTLPIANGGTNLTALGTANQILGVNAGATALEYKTLPAGGFSNMQVFASSGTFTVPTGVTKAKVTVVGGGGNGSAGTRNAQNTGTSVGVGGGGGGASIEIVTGLTPAGTVTVTVGGAAGTSSFGAFCSATGGANANGGINLNSNTRATGGVGSGGDLNIRGTAGFIIDGSGTTSFGGNGGNSIFGGGGMGATQGSTGSTAGAAGGAYGGGGGGGAGIGSNSNGAGGAGAAGVVIVEY
jgi:hypothetical protein